jgi:5-methylcytosine-specific restriction endonuclease McrA
MAHALNLDALIPREDFEVQADTSVAAGPTGERLKLSELEVGAMTYHSLRKPDFQRETADWEPDMVVDLVRSFLDGDLIPSIILWRSPASGNVFVIDGAHRLSALIAWVQNDYGAGKRSIDFSENVIPPEQTKAAEKCRDLIAKQIGTYEEVKAAGVTPGTASRERVMRARNMGSFGIQLQWVPGDAKQAEASFFKINQKAVPIGPTELLILQSRRKANAIASRAIIHAGVGHKYWSRFAQEKQDEIEKTARQIYDALFIPAMADGSIKTLDLPVAGRGYSAESVKLIFEFVHYANRINLRALKKGPILRDDPDGAETLQFLNNVKRYAQLISGKHPSSLGLHPAVYFYGATGRYQPAAFIGVVKFLEDLTDRDKLPAFTAARSHVEDALVDNPQFVNQIVREYGSSDTTISAIVDLLEGLFAHFSKGVSGSDLLENLKKHPRLEALAPITSEDRKLGKNFSKDTRSRAYLREALASATRCGICGSRLHANAITIDHVKEKHQGGTGSAANARPVHPYCNSARAIVEAAISLAAARAAK